MENKGHLTRKGERDLKLFKNERLTKVNKRVVELESNIEKIQGEIDEILQTLADNQEAFALGEISEKDLQKIEEILKEKKAEIERNSELIQQVKDVRKKVAFESIPFVKEAREKKVASLQKEYDKKVKEVHEARNEFIRQLAELGRINNMTNDVTEEYRIAMNKLGEKQPSLWGGAINEITVISRGWTQESKCLGVEESRQKQIYSSGEIPTWASNSKGE